MLIGLPDMLLSAMKKGIVSNCCVYYDHSKMAFKFIIAYHCDVKLTKDFYIADYMLMRHGMDIVNAPIEAVLHEIREEKIKHGSLSSSNA